MTKTEKRAAGLQEALHKGAGGAAHRAAIQTTRLIDERIAAYRATVTAGEPDLPAWQAPYARAFTECDAATRYALGAATLDAPAASPSTSTAFDPSPAAFELLGERCNAALAAVRAPTNGRPPMPRLATHLMDALVALKTAYGNGAPEPTPAQVAADKALEIACHEAEAFLGALKEGIAS